MEGALTLHPLQYFKERGRRHFRGMGRSELQGRNPQSPSLAGEPKKGIDRPEASAGRATFLDLLTVTAQIHSRPRLKEEV